MARRHRGWFPEPNNALLQSFWAPFLLMHLGGPGTITAYSLEDNELWLRHFLGVIVQVSVAFYVFLQSWSNSALTFIAIPMFIAGIIKYGERTWLLRASSTEHFKDSLSLKPDTCQELIIINTEELEDPSKAIVPKDGINPDDHYLVLAYFLFKRFEFLFAGRTLPTDDWDERFSVVRYMEAQDAFKLIAVELGFLYDLLHTKANIVYSRLGIFLRCICFISSFSALIVFSATLDFHAYPPPDIFVSFLLLVGAVILDVYAFFTLFFSAWTKLWLIKHEIKEGNPISRTDQLVNRFWRFTSHCHSVGINGKWWSGSMGQFNMINFCLKEVQLTCIGVGKLPFVGDFLENHMFLIREDVTTNLKEKIVNHLKRKVHELQRLQLPFTYIQARDKVLAERGGYAIRNSNRFEIAGIRWRILDVEFDTSLLLWHIATDLCYYHHLNDILGGDYNKLDSNCKISKCLSDYMLYLFLFRSSMVPISVGEIRYKGTCDSAMEFFKKMEEASDKSTFDGRRVLLQDMGDERIRSSDTSSLLSSACGLTRNIIKATSHPPDEKMWETICEVWMEMLAYAAFNCDWQKHAQELITGGELLTHVCLLMTHFGLTNKYVRAYRMP